jgi:hypothetical protein
MKRESVLGGSIAENCLGKLILLFVLYVLVVFCCFVEVFGCWFCLLKGCFIAAYV